MTTSDLLLRLWGHLCARRKRQMLLLALLLLLGALLETVSLSAVVPFLGVLAAPERFVAQPLVAKVAAMFEISSASQMLLPLTLAFGVMATVSAAIRILILWVNTRFAYAIGGEFSIETYRRTLYQPYQIHVARNSSAVISTISKKINIAIAVLYQLLMLASSVALSMAVIVALILIDMRIALVAGGVFTLLYLTIVCYTRRTLLENSRRIASQEDESIKVLQEGLGGVRDVLLDGSQELYCRKYSSVDSSLRLMQGRNVFISASPRYLMEAIGMVVIVTLAYLLTVNSAHSQFDSTLPVLGAFALGAQRLLPTMQQIYAAWVGVVGNHQALIDVMDMLDQPLPAKIGTDADCLQLRREIRLHDVHYRYVEESPWVLNGANVVVTKGERLGIVGVTGSGKSTFLDLFMGLLQPTRGYISIDDRPLFAESLRAWQQCIAHVPQNIFLADASVAENIAFGIAPGAIDMERVRYAAQQAQLSEFIESYPGGYDALVGERGVRLSGGQRQRIGIARALYKRASVLILDEATSALDNETESMVMQTIDRLDRDLTVLIVAHRLTTLRHCDRIIEMVDGQAMQCASHEQLLESRRESKIDFC